MPACSTSTAPLPRRQRCTPPPRLLRRRVVVLATQSVDLAGVGVADGQGGLDQGGVGEGLGVVAEVAVVGGVELLGEEAEGVGEFQEVGEQLGCLVGPASAGEGLDQPERTGEEGALGAGQAVLAGRVAVQQGAAGAELLAYGFDGPLDPRRVARFQVQEGKDEYGGVEVAGAVAAGVAAELGIEAGGGDLGGDGVALGLPSYDLGVRGAAGGGDAQGTVEGEPGHELGVHVVGAVAAELPDPGVGFAPPVRDLVGEAAHGPPGLGVEAMAGAAEEPGGVQHPAVAVELVLVGGAVADPDRAAVGIAGPAVQLPFRGGAAAVEGEQDGQAGPVQAAGVQQPGVEVAGFAVLADAEERADADAGVAGPGVAVVPIADPAGG